MSQEKIISFELYETIGVERGPVGLESMFTAIDMLNQSKVEDPEEAWLDTVYELKQNKPPFFYSNDYLGSPKYENGILEKCYKTGMSPQEALDWWRNYKGIK
jgi:hypothetical protein